MVAHYTLSNQTLLKNLISHQIKLRSAVLFIFLQMGLLKIVNSKITQQITAQHFFWVMIVQFWLKIPMTILPHPIQILFMLYMQLKNMKKAFWVMMKLQLNLFQNLQELLKSVFLLKILQKSWVQYISTCEAKSMIHISQIILHQKKGEQYIL